MAPKDVLISRTCEYATLSWQRRSCRIAHGQISITEPLRFMYLYLLLYLSVCMYIFMSTNTCWIDRQVDVYLSIDRQGDIFISPSVSASLINPWLTQGAGQHFTVNITVNIMYHKSTGFSGHILYQPKSLKRFISFLFLIISKANNIFLILQIYNTKQKTGSQKINHTLWFHLS